MRRVRRKGGHKEKVFGCDLLEHLAASSQEIPQVLRSCSEFIEEHGVVDGIYRLSGVSSNIQRLRSEFDSDGTPDLNKDVYFQDIHCVSSLCKAYFRELPNPLLTYQLYDKFAEAVAVQLEEERLVKIAEVLKELPSLHHKTLEFLMRHLVKMASHSAETNMHARNLAIVWAPNLLRSKDIEASGLNGTAAFMEVRVQSIVVEFILTHVAQLFPEHDHPLQRRKSLPSPSAVSNLEEPMFRAIPFQGTSHFGNISPGDGPLPIRPYHSIIEGTEKKKGSLKGRKWMSIFNIGGRFHETRRKSKNSSKDKERTTLRPAKSMDSLSTPAANFSEGSRHPVQRPPSSHLSPLATSSPLIGLEAGGALGGTGYAVAYRRGTGAAHNLLDPEGGTGGERQSPPSRSPGQSAKMARRAGMHIARPHLVTVPLHIAANLAQGVLQGGCEDRVVQCRGDRREGERRGEDKERKREVGGMAGTEDKERKREVGGMAGTEDKERKREVGGTAGTEDKADGGHLRERDVGRGQREGAAGGAKDRPVGATEEDATGERKEAERQDGLLPPQQEVGGQGTGGEQGGDNLIPSEKEERNAGAEHKDEPTDRKGGQKVGQGVSEEDNDSEASDSSASPALGGEDLELSGYVQDNFDFLDHVDCSVTNLVNEFSVEPPGYEDNEYDVMEEQNLPSSPRSVSSPNAEKSTPLDHTSDMQLLVQTRAHRPLSADGFGRPTKSLSLPYMASPIKPLLSSSSEDEADDGDTDDECSDEDSGMFYESLPSGYKFCDLTWPGRLSDEDIHSPSSLTSPKQDDDDGISIGQSDLTGAREPMGLDDEFLCSDGPSGNEGKVKATGVEEEEDRELREEEQSGDEEETQADTNTLRQSMVTAESQHFAEACIKGKDELSDEKEHPLTPEDPKNGALDFQPPRFLDTDGDTQTSLTSTVEAVVHHDHRDEEGSGGHCSERRDANDSRVTISHPSSCTGSCSAAADIADRRTKAPLESPTSPVEPHSGINFVSEEPRDEGEVDGNMAEEEMVERGKDQMEGWEVKCELEGIQVEKVHEFGAKSTRSNGCHAQGGERRDIGEQEEQGEMEEEGEIEEVGEVEEKGEMEEREIEEQGELDEGGGEGSGDIWEQCEQIICEIIEFQEKLCTGGTNIQMDGDTGGVAKVGGKAAEMEKVSEEGGEVREREKEKENKERDVSEQGRRALEEEVMIQSGIKTDDVGEGSAAFLGTSEVRELGTESSEMDSMNRNPLNGRSEGGDAKMGAGHQGLREVEEAQIPNLDNPEEHGGDDGGEERIQIQPGSGEWRKEAAEADVKESRRVGRPSKLRPETGRVLVSKTAPSTVYQVRAVPVVPPKPQHCRLTARNLRQQHQQNRDRSDAGRERECTVTDLEEDGMSQGKRDEAEMRLARASEGERGVPAEGEDEIRGRKEKQAHWGGEREKRREADEVGIRDIKRNSPISMCFDEAVAMATMKREREKESSERERQRGFDVQ